MTSVLTHEDVSEVINGLKSSGKPYCGAEVLDALLGRAHASSYTEFNPLSPEGLKELALYSLERYAEQGRKLKITHCRSRYQKIPESGPVELGADCGYTFDPIPLKCVMGERTGYRGVLQDILDSGTLSLEVYGVPRKNEPQIIDAHMLLFQRDTMHCLFSEDAFNIGYSID